MKKGLALAAKIGVSLALLGLLISWTDRGALAQRIRGADTLLLAGAVALYVVMVAISVWRWRVLLQAQGHVAPMADLSASYLVATFFNNFLPSNIGGDLIRVRDSSRMTGSTTSALAIVAIDRIIGFGALYVLALVAFVFGGPSVQHLTGARAAILALTLLFSVLGYVFFRPGTARRLMTLSRLDRLAWARAQFETVQAAVHVYRQELGAVWAAFAASLALQTSVVWYYYLVAHALRIDLALSACFLMVPLCILVQTVPLSFNGWGIREGVFVHYFRQIGLTSDSAIAFSLVGAGLIVLLSLSGAVVFMARGSGAPETGGD
jgi:glycosyltransferase 2 family protein